MTDDEFKRHQRINYAVIVLASISLILSALQACGFIT